MKCFNCDKIGHMASNYPDKESSEKRDYQDERQKNNHYRGHRDFRRRDRKSFLIADEEFNNDKLDETDTEEIFYVAIKDGSDEEKSLISHLKTNDSWIIDSGCSHHMTGDKHKFVMLEDYDGGYVRFGNDAPCLVKGKGSITLLDNAKCNDVYWVEGLKYNLLSVAQLNNTSYRIEFQKGIVKVHDKHGKFAATGTQTKGNTFHLDSTRNNCFYAKIDDTWLWHKRFCHVNFDNLIKISKKHRVRGLPSLEKLENAMCQECQMGKMTRSNFTSKSYTSKGILDLEHIDLCGPMKVQSYYGDKYFILFVDDYSRMMSVMFLKEKS